MLRIAGWKANYEQRNKTGREIKGPLSWIPISVDLTGNGMSRLRALGDQVLGCFGAWVLMLELAASRPIDKRDGVLLEAAGSNPHDHYGIAESVAMALGMPKAVDGFYAAIETLLAPNIGWLEEFGVPEQMTSSRASIPIIPLALPAPRAAQAAVADEEFSAMWNRWPYQDNEMAACQMWLSVVTADNLSAVRVCAGRYLASKEVAKGCCKGLRKWLDEQHANNWNGQWPAAESSGGLSVFDRIRPPEATGL